MKKIIDTLKAGAVIKIEGVKPEHRNHCPAEFWYDNARGLMTYAPGWGVMNRPDMSPARLTRHINNMVAEGFRVTIETNPARRLYYRDE